jgi:hypothetical protein
VATQAVQGRKERRVQGETLDQREHLEHQEVSDSRDFKAEKDQMDQTGMLDRLGRLALRVHQVLWDPLALLASSVTLDSKDQLGRVDNLANWALQERLGQPDNQGQQDSLDRSVRQVQLDLLVQLAQRVYVVTTERMEA